MKRALLFSTLAAATLLAGCDTLSDASDRVREKLAARERPRAHIYTSDSRATYEAVRVTADQMGYRFLRGGPAQGELDAISGLATDDAMRSTRQISMKVRLHATLDGGTEVSVVLDEIIEADSRDHAGQGTSTPLRDTPQYDAFFRHVQQALDAAKAPPTG
jgi:hypothetical protein